MDLPLIICIFVLGIIILFPIVMFILLVAKYIITEAIEYFTKK